MAEVPQQLKKHCFTSDQDREKARENGRKGGKASAEAKREKKQFQDVVKELLDMPMKKGKISKKIEAFMDLQGSNVTMREAIVAAMIQSSIQDKNVKAAQFVAEIAGELVNNVNISGELPVVIQDDIAETD